ncbi:hypothetical protein VQ643_09910 [Pseudomonas sp. F1_0610]|uniref:hypothetical protein n=1 Tax=Pseudomonas sp. F1_0610 TaxID=3114284 RepID=UPI0039C16DC0
MSATSNAVEVGKVVYAFEGDLGATVWLLRYDTKENNKALIQIMFVDNELNGKIILAEVDETQKHKHYVIQLNNKPHSLLIQDKNKIELFLPGEQSNLDLVYNKNLSRAGNPQAFLAEYESQ